MPATRAVDHYMYPSHPQPTHSHLLWDDDARLPVISFAERNGTFAQALYLRRGSWDGITVTSTGEPFDAEHARVG